MVAAGYVINNWRRHGADWFSKGTQAALVDPYATGLVHPAWAARFEVPDYYVPLPVLPPQTWLLREGYKCHGELDPREVPADWLDRWTYRTA